MFFNSIVVSQTFFKATGEISAGEHSGIPDTFMPLAFPVAGSPALNSARINRIG